MFHTGKASAFDYSIFRHQGESVRVTQWRKSCVLINQFNVMNLKMKNKKIIEFEAKNSVT